MSFKESYRAEVKAFQELKSSIELLKTWKENEEPGKTLDVLNACISADKAIILLYKNIGEAWNDLASQIVADKAALEALKSELESTKDETNEKIDEVNNYLNGRLNTLETVVNEEIEPAISAIQRRLDTIAKKYYSVTVSADPTRWTLDNNTGTYYFIANATGDPKFDDLRKGIYMFTGNFATSQGYVNEIDKARSSGLIGTIFTVGDHRYARFDAPAVPTSFVNITLTIIFEDCESDDFTKDRFVQGF